MNVLNGAIVAVVLIFLLTLFVIMIKEGSKSAIEQFRYHPIATTIIILSFAGIPISLAVLISIVL